MKKYILSFLVLSWCIAACTSKDDTKNAASSGIKLPYEASYSSDFTNNVPDSDVLVTLNSYKTWENADYTAFRATMADSVEMYMSDGSKLKGRTDSLMSFVKNYRDSLSSTSIKMIAWTKNHSPKDSINFVNVWYKEIDTFKTGKVDSAEYEDDNGLKNGKIIYFSSHRQTLK